VIPFGTPEGGDLSQRECAVLSAVIERHILTAEPVSSSQVCAHYAFGYSPATVRSVMVRLEDAGFLSHPYTSAGKIPSVKAYRFFVDRLLQGLELSTVGRPGLHPELLEQVREVDQMIKLTAGVLAAVSQLLAVSWVAGGARERLARVELLRLAAQKILLVTFTETAAEIHHVLEMPDKVNPELLARAARWINERGRGLSAQELGALAQGEWPTADRRLGELLRPALAAIRASLSAPTRTEVAMEGAGNLISQPEFNNVGTVRRLVSMLDRREELLQSFAAPGLERDGLRVVIGGENTQSGLPPLSFITIGIGLQTGQSACLGVIGPMRMAYGRIISLLGSTAATVARALERS
jgi:heat-inducible transcriptional repressor